MAALTISIAGCSKSSQNTESAVSTESTKESSMDYSMELSLSEYSVQPEENFTVVPSSCTMEVDEKRKLIIQTSSGEKDNSDYTWVSDNNGVVTVDSEGFIKGVSAGSAIITVSKNAVTSQVNIIVQKKQDPSSQPVTTSHEEESSYVSTVQESVQESVQNTYNSYSYADPDDAAYAYYTINNYLSTDYVNSLTVDDAQLLINTIYAKHGYIFKTDYIRTFYETQYWYNNIYDKSSSLEKVRARFSSMDKTNAKLLEGVR